MIPAHDVAIAHWLAANRTAIAAKHDAKARAAARAQLAATLARMRAPIPARSGDPRAAVARELAVPGRYDVAARSTKPREKTPWERFWDWVGAGYDRFWKALTGKIHLGGAGQAVLGDLLLLVAAGALIFATVRLLAGWRFERASRRGASTPLDAGRNAHALYLQACALARDGAYADAARALFLAAVTAMDLRGIVRDDASATVGDMRRALRARDAATVAPFDAVAAPFVAAAYAERDVDAGEWERALAGYRRLVRDQPG